MMRATPAFAALLLAGLSGAAPAQILTSLTAEPARVRVGQPVDITADFDVKAGVNCGIRLRFSDGSAEQYYKLNQTGDVPLQVSRTFDKPGKVTIFAEPRTKLPMFKCGGKDLTAVVEVLPK